MKLQEIDNKAAETLLKALDLTTVYIVTNAVSGWVEYSAKGFMPKTYVVIKRYDIKVVSARTKY